MSGADSTDRTRLFVPPSTAAEEFSGVVRLDWVDEEGPHSLVLERRAVVGSAPHAEVRIVDDTVSRLHAELLPGKDGLWVRDLHSSNGSWLSAIRVERALLGVSGRVRFGKVVVVVTHLTDRRPTAAELDSIDEVDADHCAGLYGKSAPMRSLFALLRRVAQVDSPVLVSGETGTGKELVARAIHDLSPRAAKPFVIVDCAALPESLLDAELFGHLRGTFTGATSDRVGAIESAHGGTIFLDEVGELPLAMQPKLLRALEAGTIRRLGDTRHRAIDVRFVSATHRDLAQMVVDGQFREDLYFRLQVLSVDVPPLRERLEDVEILVGHFLRSQRPLDRKLLDELRRRPWTGNVRELRNFVDRMRALGLDRALEMGVKPARRKTAAEGDATVAKIEATIPLREFREGWIAQGERGYLLDLLRRHDNNISAAARVAAVDRTYFYKLIRKHGIEPKGSA